MSLKSFSKVFFILLGLFLGYMVIPWAASATPAPYLTITASASAHGNITPSGKVRVVYQASQTFSITPSSGYVVSSVVIDGFQYTGFTYTGTSTYTFTSLTSNHTIRATFALNTVTITASSGINGSITPPGKTFVSYASSQTYTITPNTGFEVLALKVDGKKFPVYTTISGGTGTSTTYTFSEVTAHHTIKAEFTPSLFIITATASNFGTISPSGLDRVSIGSSPTFNFTPSSGYGVGSVYVNGKKVKNPSATSYTFGDVIKNQTIHVTFIPSNISIAKAGDTSSTESLPSTDVPVTAVAPTPASTQAASLYESAVSTIATYQSSPTNTNLTTAVQAVMALRPYNSVAVSAISSVGVYDAALNQLVPMVESNLPTTSVASITPPINADNSFSSAVAVDSGSVFVSAPSYLANGFGTVYEFKKNSQNKWVLANEIFPNAPNPGEHFGGSIAVKDGMLAASALPLNGEAKVYLFTRQLSGIWAQQDVLNLTDFSQLPSYPLIPAIHQISLAASVNRYGGYVVVGLPEFGKYMVFNQQYTYYLNGKLHGSSWRLALEGSIMPKAVVTPISVAAEGDYIAIGAPQFSLVRILEATNIAAMDSNSPEGAVKILYTDWAVDPGLANDVHGHNAGFGQSVALEQSPEPTAAIGATLPVLPAEVINQVTLAIGSPQESSGKGAVYTMVKGNPATKTFVWSSPGAINLLASSSDLGLGSALALNDATLMIDSSSTSADVLVYSLNANNQWVWADTLTAPYAASIATNSNTVAVGEPIPNGKSGTSEVTVISL